MDMSIMKLITKTSPFIITRIIVYAIFTLIAFLFIGLMIGVSFLLFKMFGESAFFVILLMIGTISGVFGGLRFVERYFLYIVKIGHVSVITELLRTGEMPEKKNMISYGKQQVTENFGATNVAFVLDNMVKAAIRQIQRWINRVGNFLKFIPGSQYAIMVVNAVMYISLSYVDEAIMSYVFLRKSEKKEETVWKSASDGVVLYAQSWKGIIKAAVISVVFIIVFNIAIFLLFLFPLLFLSKMIAGDTPELGTLLGILAVIAATMLTTVAKRAFIDPVVTVIMIRAYQMSIRNLEPAMDLQSKLLGVSSKFKKLFNKAKEKEKEQGEGEEPYPPAEAQTQI